MGYLINNTTFILVWNNDIGMSDNENNYNENFKNLYQLIKY